MDLYVATMACGDSEYNRMSELIGVFSTKEKAEDAARIYAPVTGDVDELKLDAMPDWITPIPND